MKKYIILTSDGQCESPEYDEVENLQVLGRTSGATEYEAVETFLKQNDWVISMGYKPENFIIARLHDSESV